MHKILESRNIKISLLFALIGSIASIFVAYYQISVFGEPTKQMIIEQLGSLKALIPLAALQGALITCLASLIGLKLAESTNLKLNAAWDRNAFIKAAIIGLATAFIIVGSDRFIFAPYLPTTIDSYAFSPIYFISGILYGGIVEEILLRLFAMSLFVFLIWKIFAKKQDRFNIPGWVYIASIFLASALFAVGHLPFTAQLMELSAPIIVRCFVLNGIGGIGFGFLYWKKGLTYSMVSHATTHVFMQALFMPILF